MGVIGNATTDVFVLGGLEGDLELAIGRPWGAGRRMGRRWIKQGCCAALASGICIAGLSWAARGDLSKFPSAWPGHVVL